jgi:hypothetical protein
MRRVYEWLEELTDEELEAVPEWFMKEKEKRLIRDLIPGTKVITLTPGFGGMAGIICYFVGYGKNQVHPRDGSCANFSDTPDGIPRWGVLKSSLIDKIKILKE